MFVLFFLGLVQALEPLQELHEKLRLQTDSALFEKWDAIIRDKLSSLSIEQYNQRFTNLQANYQRVKVMNAENTVPGLVFGVSHIDQYSDAEYSQLLTFRAAPELLLPTLELDATDEPGIDWQKLGAVTPVKGQHACGSCWAFSVTAVLESRWFIEGNPLTPFSEQQIIDCNPSGYDCDGGWMKPVLDGLPQMHRMQTESEYPYLAKKGDCQADPHSESQFLISTARIRKNDYQSMMTALVKYGVLAVVVDADGDGFRHYESGIVDEISCMLNNKKPGIDHAVALVGFGYEHGIQYFRIKNSWGEEWGDNGYIRLRGLENACLVSNHVVVAMHKGDHLYTSTTTKSHSLECNPTCKHCEFRLLGRNTVKCDLNCITDRHYMVNKNWCHKHCICVEYGTTA